MCNNISLIPYQPAENVQNKNKESEKSLIANSSITTTVMGIIAAGGAMVGNLYGKGLTVRVFSPIIFDAVYKRTILSTGHMLGAGYVIANISANSAVGSAIPMLTYIGSISGGAGGAFLASVISYGAAKTVKYATDKVSLLFTSNQVNASKVCLPESKIQVKVTVKAKEAEDINKKTAKNNVKKWNSPCEAIALKSLRNRNQVTYEI